MWLVSRLDLSFVVRSVEYSGSSFALAVLRQQSWLFVDEGILSSFHCSRTSIDHVSFVLLESVLCFPQTTPTDDVKIQLTEMVP